MVSRREFIQRSALGSAAVLAPSLISCGGARPEPFRFGFISGIVGKELQADWQGTLKQAVEMGFTEFEGGIRDVPPEEFLAFCREIGLTPIAGGLGMSLIGVLMLLRRR